MLAGAGGGGYVSTDALHGRKVRENDVAVGNKGEGNDATVHRQSLVERHQEMLRKKEKRRKKVILVVVVV